MPEKSNQKTTSFSRLGRNERATLTTKSTARGSPASMVGGCGEGKRKGRRERNKGHHAEEQQGGVSRRGFCLNGNL